MRGSFSRLAAAVLGASALVTWGCGASSPGRSLGTGGSLAGGTGTGGGGAGGTAAPGTGGAGGAGGAAQSCTFTQSSSPSQKIGTVGIVTWSTTLAAPQSARIDFGLTTSYGMSAPVDLTQPSYRTLLLGMKSSHTYHYRITATNSGGNPARSPNSGDTSGSVGSWPWK